MTDEEMKLREEAKEIYENKSTNDTWLLLFFSLLMIGNSHAPNVQLEKEVSYLSGKVDTLEKIIMSKEK